MSTIEKLVESFRQFPGIGPRQAKRFVYFLLTRNPHFIDELSTHLKELKKEVSLCSTCFRFFDKRKISGNICATCDNQNRDKSKMMIVEKDVDLENIERSGAYKGLYFVLGGSVPVLEKEPERYVRSNELLERVEKNCEDKKCQEIILALSNNSDGDNTSRFLNEILSPLLEKYDFKISTLGRGLSTGTELEYSDSETIKNALENRH